MNGGLIRVCGNAATLLPGVGGSFISRLSVSYTGLVPDRGILCVSL